jgi:hypothetical protein
MTLPPLNFDASATEHISNGQSPQVKNIATVSNTHQDARGIATRGTLRRPVPPGTQESAPQLSESLILSVGQEDEGKPAGNQSGNLPPGKERPDELFDRQESALGRIFDAVHRTKHQLTGTAPDEAFARNAHPEGISTQAIEMISQVKHLDAKLTRIEKEMESAKEKLMIEHSNRVAEAERAQVLKAEGGSAVFREMIKGQQTQISQLTSSTSKLEEQIKEMRKRYTEDRAQLTNSHDQDKKQWQKGLDDERKATEQRLKDEVKERTKKLNDQVSSMKSKREEEMNGLRREAEAKRNGDMRTLEAKKDGERRTLELVKDEEIRKLRAYFEHVMNQLQTEKSNLEANINDMLDRHPGEISRVREETSQQYRTAIDRLNGEVARLESGKRDMELQHQNHVRSINQTNKNEVEELTQSHLEEIREKDEGFAAERLRYDRRYQKAISGHEADVARLESKYAGQERLLVARYEQEQKRLVSGYEQEQLRLNTELAGFQGKSDAEIDNLVSKYEARLEKLESEHQARLEKAELDKERDLKDIKAEKERLKVALVQRGHFKAMTDHQLSNSFRDLAGEIDEIARVRWDPNREGEWPWPEHILRKSENERRLKHDIIRTRIWVVLYQHIFCTPFRILGEEGRSMEKQWAEASGQRMYLFCL